ncbi:hypothetical protein ACH5RR_022567 [Cinchona calisaya]|uniref:F-box domain-containing protein n=1 Tax=Cinchona calisaya TaxID=153742 RepID=A0ABD2ZBG6_9GENT
MSWRSYFSWITTLDFSWITTLVKEEDNKNNNKGEEVENDATIVLDFWSRLPEDMKVDILCRLEEKDLIGFKSVSKDWNSLISKFCVRILSPPSPSAPFCGFLTFEDPRQEESDFPRANNNNNNNVAAGGELEEKKLSLLFIAMGKYMGRDFRQKVRLAQRIMDLLPPGYEASDIQHYCNGLFLLVSSQRNPVQYYVCNPATNQCVGIAVNPNHQKITNPPSYEEYHSSLAFDPSSNYTNNYGCNYRIVHYISRSSATEAPALLELELDVFCSETREWTSHVVPLQLPPNNHNNFLYSFPGVGFDWIKQTVYKDGILYYLTSLGYLVCININILLSSADHSKTEVCWAVELPDTQQDTNTSDQKEVQEFGGCIGISSGCFYYSNRHSQSRSTMLVWMLLVVDNGKAYRSKWILRHTINTDEMVGTPPFEQAIKKNIESCWPFAFHPYDDQIIYMAARKPPLLFTYLHRTKHASMAVFPWFLRKTVLEQKLIFPYSRCLLPLIHLEEI